MRTIRGVLAYVWFEVKECAPGFAIIAGLTAIAVAVAWALERIGVVWP